MSRYQCASIALFVAAVWMFTHPGFVQYQAGAQESNPSSVEKWEYKIIKKELSEEQLAQLGEERWELVQVIPNAKFSEIQGSSGGGGGNGGGGNGGGGNGGGNGINSYTRNSTEFCAYFKRSK